MEWISSDKSWEFKLNLNYLWQQHLIYRQYNFSHRLLLLLLLLPPTTTIIIILTITARIYDRVPASPVKARHGTSCPHDDPRSMRKQNPKHDVGEANVRTYGVSCKVCSPLQISHLHWLSYRPNASTLIIAPTNGQSSPNFVQSLRAAC